MTGRPSERFAWIASTVGGRLDDQVLEIGSGHGVLARLIAERLESGHLQGLDRSAKMTTAALTANADLVKAGRASFSTGRVQNLDPSAMSYDLVIAARVREIWTDPFVLPLLRRAINDDGRLMLFVDSPRGVVPASTFRTISRRLHDAGFDHLDARSHQLSVGEVSVIEATG